MNFRKSLSALFTLLIGIIIFSQVSWAVAETSGGDPISSALSSPITTAIILVTQTTENALSPAGGSSPAPVCNNEKPGSAPVLLSAKQTGSNQVTLIWSKAKNPVTYYMVSYGLSSKTKMFGNPNVGDENTTSYTISHLSTNQTYYFTVRAGHGCMPGDFSNELSVKIGGGQKLKGNAGNFDSFVVATSKTYNYNDSVGIGQTLPDAVFVNTPKTSPSERIFESLEKTGTRLLNFFQNILPH